jgi:hypothetical protein
MDPVGAPRWPHSGFNAVDGLIDPASGNARKQADSAWPMAESVESAAWRRPQRSVIPGTTAGAARWGGGTRTLGTTNMTKFLTVLASTSALALVSVAAPTTAEARCVGCAVGAGIVGGIAAGAIIAGATNRGYYDGAYAYEPGYAYGSGYAYEPGYAYSEPVYGGYGYGYRHRRAYSTGDVTNMDRQLQGTR